MSSTPGLGETVTKHLLAGFASLWIHSQEQDEALLEIVARCRGDFPTILQWDCHVGLRQLRNAQNDAMHWRWEPRLNNGKPILTLEDVLSLLSEGGEPDKRVKPAAPTPLNGAHDQADRLLIIMRNLELVLTGGGRVQALRNYLYNAERFWLQRLVNLSTLPEPPPPVGDKTFTCLRQPLPDSDLLLEELRSVTGASTEEECPDLAPGETYVGVVAAAKGLTRIEARNQFSLCLLEEPAEITAARVFRKKKQAIEQQGLGLDVLTGTLTFDDIGGYEWAKRYVMAMINASARYSEDRDLKPRGIILAGVPGVGKSLFSLAVGNACTPRRPTIRWSPALTGSKYVSQGAQNQRKVLEIFEQNAPMIIQVDLN